MQTEKHVIVATLVVALAAARTIAGTGPLTTAFTYQGQLKQLGMAVDDLCDFEFRLFDALTGGTQIGPTLTFDGVGGNVAAVNVVAGLFTVKLDFGVGVFTGDARFLEIRVRCPSGAGVYHLLNPRQPICAAPYALFALDSPPDFSLPLSVTLNSPATALSITNENGGVYQAIATGFGNAGQFIVENPNSSAAAILVSSDANNAPGAIGVIATGMSRAGNFRVQNAASPAEALTAITTGLGAAGRFEIQNADSSNVAVQIASNASDDGLYSLMTGAGGAGFFEINAPAPGGNTSHALTAVTNAAGGAGSFRIEVDTPDTNIAEALSASTNGAGGAGAFSIVVADPATNVTTALSAYTNGAGRAASFLIDEGSNVSNALEAVTLGGGRAASFLIDEGSNVSDALEAVTNGRGGAASFRINADDPLLNFAPAVYALTNGSGSAGVFDIQVAEPATFASTVPALFARTNRGGPGGRFLINVDQPNLNSDAAVSASTNGIGRAGLFEIDNPFLTLGNESPALEARTNGRGRAGFFVINVPAGTENLFPAIEARTNSVGSAAYLQRGPSTTNFNTIPNAALVTHTSGGGPAGLFLKPTAADNHPAILAQGLGSSPAAVFRQGDAFSSTIISGAAVHVLNGRMTGAGLNAQITNSANSSPALSASSSGSAGAVADFSSFSNGFLPTVFMQSNTSAQVLLVNHEGTGGRIARFQRDNPGTAGGGVEIDIVGTGVALDVVHRGTGRALDVEMNPPTDTICAYISNNHSGGRALRVENLQGTGGPFGGAALEVVGPALFSANPGLLALRTLGAVELNGSVQVNGVLCAETVCAEVKNFRIDHPLEPERKYLYHASIESSEMLNLYSGNVTTDAGGYATVELPEWFEALNTDFRYQLTVIGSFTQAIIAEKIRGGRFVVRTDQPGVEVSWQVTGVRHDAYARAHPLVVEAEKQPQERRHAFHSEVSQSAAHAAAQGSFHP